MTKLRRAIGKFRLRDRVAVLVFDGIELIERELELRGPASAGPAEAATTRITEGLSISVRAPGAAAAALEKITYRPSNLPPTIAPPASIGGLLVERDAEQYQLIVDQLGRTPTVLVQPLAKLNDVLSPVVSRVKGSNEITFSVPAGTAPFRVRLM